MNRLNLLGCSNKLSSKGSKSWASYWTNLYKIKVEAEGGLVTDISAVKAELDYLKTNDIYTKVDYLVNTDFGQFTGSEPVGRAPFVVFSFDDGFLNYYTDTFETFKAKGTGRGTFYMNAKFTEHPELAPGFDYMTWANAIEMYEDGCDMQCHSYSHAMKDVYGINSELWQLTDAEILAEITNNDDAFVANGLPKPIHHAYPRYLGDFNVLKILAPYRKSIRGRNDNTIMFSTEGNYYNANWYGVEGLSVDYGSDANMTLAKAYILRAFTQGNIVLIHGHSTESVRFPDLLDYCIGLGIEYGTMTEACNKITAYRNKLFNLVINNYEPLIRLDSGRKIGTKQGEIIFNDTFANIGATIADRYVSEGYRVMFWDDDTDAALAYAIPNNDKYFDEEPVIASEAADTISMTPLISMQVGDNFYLTGTTPPGGLSFNTNYQVQARAGNYAVKVKLPGGGLISITSAGEDVRLSTYTYRSKLVEWDAVNPLSKVSTIVSRLYPVTGTTATSKLDLSHYNFKGDINDCGLGLFTRLGLGLNNYGLVLSFNKFTGSVDDSIVNCQNLRHLDMRCNLITGGLDNIFKLTSLQQLFISGCQITGTLPTSVGNMKNLTTLDVSVNQFSGTIPDEIGGLTGITINLTLNSNQFSGTLPESMKNIISAIRFYLSNNQLSGYVAGTFNSNMVNCILVDLSNNAISSTNDIAQIVLDCSAMVTVTSKTLTLSLQGVTNASMADTTQGGIWGDFSGVAAPSDLAIALKNIDITKSGTVNLQGIVAPAATGDGTGFPAGFGDWYRS